MRPVRREDALGPRQSQGQDALRLSLGRLIPNVKSDQAWVKRKCLALNGLTMRLATLFLAVLNLLSV